MVIDVEGGRATDPRSTHTFHIFHIRAVELADISAPITSTRYACVKDDGQHDRSSICLAIWTIASRLGQFLSQV